MQMTFQGQSPFTTHLDMTPKSLSSLESLEKEDGQLLHGSPLWRDLQSGRESLESLTVDAVF